MLGVTTLLLVVVIVQLCRAEVIVITSAEENTSPVFEVYNITEDAVRTVQKVNDSQLIFILRKVDRDFMLKFSIYNMSLRLKFSKFQLQGKV